MRRSLSFAALAAALVSCSKKEEAPRAPTPLQIAAESAAVSPACRSRIPVDWARGWPVPSSDGTQRFIIFFYPLTGTPETGPVVHTPTGEAVLDAAAGTPVTCVELPAAPKKLPGERWPAALSDIDMEGFERLSDVLYSKTESAARAYAAKKEDKAQAEGYLAAFESMAEPKLLGYYYRLNPDFWEWVRKSAGRSIPRSD